MREISRQDVVLRSLAAVAGLSLTLVAFTLSGASTQAQTQRLVEGNCATIQESTGTTVTPGACGDYDGDGRIGKAEDEDGDNVFGTIVGAFSGINQLTQLTVTVVTSGVFAYGPSIYGAGGSTVILQAAPGVEAVIDSFVVSGLALGPDEAPGITVINFSSGGSRRKPDLVVLRNLTIRNFNKGILVAGNVHVAIENCRVGSIADVGIEVGADARVTISKTEVHGIGYLEVLSDTDFARTPFGIGIRFSDNSTGTVFLTTVSSNTGVGILNRSSVRNAVCAYLVNVFDNSPNYLNVTPTSEPCGYGNKGRTFFGR